MSLPAKYFTRSRFHLFIFETKISFMKKILLSAVALLFCSFLLKAQKDYKVVFDLTSGDSLSQQTAIRWASEVAKADPTAQVEVVMFGKGTALAVKDKSAVADGIANLATNKNVSFKICAVAMQNQKIDKSQLLPGIQIVPDGIYEIISKQREGWGYIKVAH
jgi:intracellular sulfur oxidation DsrE/DsrF family protein